MALRFILAVCLTLAAAAAASSDSSRLYAVQGDDGGTDSFFLFLSLPHRRRRGYFSYPAVTTNLVSVLLLIHIIHSHFQCNAGLKFQSEVGPRDIWLANAEFRAYLNTTGWDHLAVVTNPYVRGDEAKASAAGALEGQLTATQIWQWHQNFVWGVFGGKPPTALLLACTLSLLWLPSDT